VREEAAEVLPRVRESLSRGATCGGRRQAGGCQGHGADPDPDPSTPHLRVP
jgi:hypothetical protein